MNILNNCQNNSQVYENDFQIAVNSKKKYVILAFFSFEFTLVVEKLNS